MKGKKDLFSINVCAKVQRASEPSRPPRDKLTSDWADISKSLTIFLVLKKGEKRHIVFKQ